MSDGVSPRATSTAAEDVSLAASLGDSAGRFGSGMPAKPSPGSGIGFGGTVGAVRGMVGGAAGGGSTACTLGLAADADAGLATPGTGFSGSGFGDSAGTTAAAATATAGAGTASDRASAAGTEGVLVTGLVAAGGSGFSGDRGEVSMVGGVASAMVAAGFAATSTRGASAGLLAAPLAAAPVSPGRTPELGGAPR
jgi:hypothetical protein